MRIEYDDLRADVIKKKSLEFLDKYGIHPHPYAYAVAYDYITTVNVEINQQINHLIKTNKDLTADNLKEIYYENLKGDSTVSNDATNTLLKLLTSLIGTLDPSSSNIEELVQYLSKVSTQLKSKGTKTASDINHLVDELVVVTGRALLKQNELSSRVKSTENEIKDLKLSLEISKKAVETDPLTGLVNRFGFDNTIELWRKEEFINCGLLLCDVDYFKSVNDNYGHLIGDKVLIRIGKEIKEQIKGKDIVCRWGGEEFAILLKDVSDMSQVRGIAEKVRLTIEAIKLVHSKSREVLPAITISIGVTILRDHSDWEAMIERADKALYQAKADGRNKVVTKK